MATAIAHGVENITPVATLEECKLLKESGHIAAAEREGQKAEGFDLGNSPFSYMDESVRGKQIAVTTTNGTLAITKSKGAVQVVIGSFLNITSVANYLKSQPYDVLVLCAGWKGKFNLEDTLFAGALVAWLQPEFEKACDAPIAAFNLFKSAENNLMGFLSDSSHVKRLRKLNIQKDIEFCLRLDEYEVVPVLHEGKIKKMVLGKAVKIID